MQDDPMTQEEINAAREWIGGGGNLSDAEIVEMASNSIWLASMRIDAARQKMVFAMADCMKDGLNS